MIRVLFHGQKGNINCSLERFFFTFLTHLCLIEFPAPINWTTPFPFKGLLGGTFHFISNFNRTFCKQTVEILRCAASDLGLHCLPMSRKKDARLILVKKINVI